MENLFNPITQIYYWANAGSGSDDSPILGSFSSIGKFISLPNPHSIARVGLYNIFDAWFVVEDVKNDNIKTKIKM